MHPKSSKNYYRKFRRSALAVCVLTALAAARSANADFPPWPVIPSQTFNVLNYGAKGDGTTDNATAIQNAINAAATAGGGIVEIPAPGTYECGPLTMSSSINLQIDSGAELQMLPMSLWPSATTFINGTSLHDVEISGSGVIDGNGAAWWNPVASSRPDFINFSKTIRILFRDVTLQNPPTFHLMLKGNNGDITVTNVTINTPGNSPNTDGMDLASTNILVINSFISDGDDNIEIGGSQLCADVTVTNCAFGTGHGVSVGSITSGGVSNVLVMDCTFSNTSNGIRIKSDNDRGGLVQNLTYQNLTMANVAFPIVIYAYYNSVGTPTSIWPSTAAGESVAQVSSTTPIYRDITISNLTDNSGSSDPAGLIWGRTELPVTNLNLSKISISAPRPFEIYNAYQVQCADCSFSVPAGTNSYEFFDAGVTITNSSVSTSPVTLDGKSTSSYSDTLSLYNATAVMNNTNTINNNPALTVSASTLAITNHLNLGSSSALTFGLGGIATSINVSSNLAVNGTINVNDAGGFTAGTYTLFNYGGSLTWGPPTLGTTPTGFTCQLDTSTSGKVNLIVTSNGGNPPPTPTGLTATAVSSSQIDLSWNASTGATSYNVKRATVSGGPYTTIATGVTATSFSDAGLSAGTTYYYVVSAVSSGGESANSTEASATTQPPPPPPAPTGLAAAAGNNQVGLSWNASSGATSYNVKRATVSGGPYTTIAGGVTTTAYTDTTAVNGTTYYYVVSAVNSGGESPNSSQVSATPSAPVAPNPPTNLTATAGKKKVTLNWTQSNSANITNNKVYRSTVNGGPYSLITTLAATTSFTDTGLTAGKTYYYVVTAVNNSGLESADSNQASATAK